MSDLPPSIVDMSTTAPDLRLDAARARKARGAFFTPEPLTRHLTKWAVRHRCDRVLEPSAGEAAFLTAAVERLQQLGTERPEVFGVEIHQASAAVAETVVREAGGEPRIVVQDFFTRPAEGVFDAVIGNPPFIRYQEWTGAQRARARAAALAQGVALTGLASSWAPFVVHAAAFLKPGGRLGLVLPAELLTVNYAAPVRRFLLESFRGVELVVFEEQLFPDAMAETVLVKANGWREKPTGTATLRQTRNAATLEAADGGALRRPVRGDERWSPVPLASATLAALEWFRDTATFVPLQEYGETSLGAVTGNNKYFTMSPAQATDLGIPARDLVRISPPGSAHLRGLALSRSALDRLGWQGAATRLLRPGSRPAPGTLAYLDEGVAREVDQAYKCRVRSPWWKVPLLDPPDLFLTYMNGDTARITTNTAGVHHLNSVHGVYLSDEHRALARELLPLASLNSVTLLSAELVGRSYGGGILKIEPREADAWLMPAPALLAATADELRTVKRRVQTLLSRQELLRAVHEVDTVLFDDRTPVPRAAATGLASIRNDHLRLQTRRKTRGGSRGRAK